MQQDLKEIMLGESRLASLDLNYGLTQISLSGSASDGSLEWNSADPAAFGFLDPDLVICVVHLFPMFDNGETLGYLPVKSHR